MNAKAHLKYKGNNMIQDKIIGIGTAGVSILNTIADEKLKNIRLIAIDAAQDSLLHSKAHETILLGEHGLGSGGDPIRGAEFTEAAQDTIYEALANTKRLMLTYGLGGGTGAGAAPVVARLAHVMGVEDIRAVVVFPFTFEGQTRNMKAKNSLTGLKAKVPQVRVLQGDNLLSFIGRQAPLQEVYSVVERVAMWQILSHLTS